MSKRPRTISIPQPPDNFASPTFSLWWWWCTSCCFGSFWRFFRFWRLQGSLSGVVRRGLDPRRAFVSALCPVLDHLWLATNIFGWLFTHFWFCVDPFLLRLPFLLIASWFWGRGNFLDVLHFHKDLFCCLVLDSPVIEQRRLSLFSWFGFCNRGGIIGDIIGSRQRWRWLDWNDLLSFLSDDSSVTRLV